MPKPNKTTYKFCPHCGYTVHRSTFYNHKVLFHENGKWIKPSTKANESPLTKKSQNDKNQGINEMDEEMDMSHDEDSSYSDNEFLSYSATNDGMIKQQQFIECFTGKINRRQEEISDGIKSRLFEIWEDISYDDIKCDLSDETEIRTNLNRDASKAMVLVNWIVLFISMWAAFFNISNNAIEYLIHFLKGFFQICGYSIPVFAIAATLFPSSLYNLYKLQGLGRDQFVKYVVCPSCSSIYKYEDCLKKEGDRTTAKNCCYIKFPNHPHFNKRKPCGTPLLKQIKLKGGKEVYYPRKIYCYKGIINSLKEMLQRPDFLQKCELWRKRTYVPGTFRDVYDGRIWRQFEVYKSDDGEEKEFLSLPGRFGFMLNLDWFQPYKYSPYSIGAIYLSIMNLPREERFKENNIILVSLLPGPHEVDAEGISFYLKPIVDELLLLWTGIEYNSECYYGALLACSCDLPAGRKLCGMYSFSARVGCSKCTKEFSVANFGEKANYGGFEKVYPKRNYNEMKDSAKKAQKARTKAERNTIEKKVGCRWSELMRLPYFDATSQLLIDPMHGLYLGTAKAFISQIWPNHSNLSSQKMMEIQEHIDNTDLPSDVGRIPHKIASNFSSFTSDQLKNWVLYFSIFTMKTYLSKTAYDVWLKFVTSSWLYSRPVITIRELSKAHEEMISFCKSFEEWLKSSEYTTPNMHFHTHLIDCVLDFGPFYGFWLYSFERYNGTLGGFHTNNRSIEIQIMRKFLRNQHVAQLEIPLDFRKELFPSLAFTKIDAKGSLSLNNIRNMPVETLQLYFKIGTESLLPNLPDYSLFCEESVFEFIGDGKLSFMEIDIEKECLYAALEAFLGPVEKNNITGSYVKFSALKYLGEAYGSFDSQMARNCHIIVNSWVGIDCQINQNTNEDRPGEVLYYLKMFIPIDGQYRPIVLAAVRWFQKHESVNIFKTNLATVWCKSLFEIDGPAMFVPVQKIKGKFISGFTKVKGEAVRVVIPKVPKIYW